MQKKARKIIAMMLAIIMLVGIIPTNVFAASIYDDANGGSNYYNVISEKEWDIAPGIKEYEQVLNNDGGTRRQVLHTATVDMNNPFTKVIAGYKGMKPDENGNFPMGYGTQSTSVQALEAEKLGYGNVVVATNTTLSWYDRQYYKDNPHMIGEPLGYTILDGELFVNSSWKFDEETQKFTKHDADGTQTVIVINYDKHPITGEERPADMPKVWIRATTDPITGWEYQAIPVSFGFLVKPDANGNPVNQYKTEDHGSGIASRTFVGVKSDGTLVITVSDGEQAPYSTGFTNFEMADYMIKMGCVVAANCDGGGSTTFCSQRPGEDLKVNCSLSDGGERPTTSTILVITTAPADGQFARANISTDYDYYTPGSIVSFSALGTDAVGTKVDIPDDVEWKIKEADMGTIENGVFTSNGTEGTVTAQMVYNGDVVGERAITIVTPDTIYFEQPVVTIPFGKTAKIPVKASATINDVAQDIGLGANDVSFNTTNNALGSFDGLNFVAVSEANAPADTTSTVTATLNMGTRPTATVQLNLGKGSEVLWDFEDGQVDVDEWNVINSRTNDYRDYYMKLSLADSTNGQVHDGEHSLRLEINGLSSKKSDSSDYAWIRLGVDGDAIELENARRIGFWLYVPEDNIQCWVQGHYMTDSNGDGTYDNLATVSMMESEDVYYNIDESGWHYLSMDISAFEKVALKYSNQFNKQNSTGQTSEKGEFFLAIVTHRTKNNLLWQNNGTINGPYTYYFDNFTVDYSDAVDDREKPVFDKIYLDGTTALVKREVITTTSNILNLSAAVADATTLEDAMGVAQPLYNVSGLNADTAKVYIDGNEVKSSFANGVISATGIKVADGYHRVKFEICDNMGNKSVIIRVVEVKSGSDDSTLKLVPADATLDRIPFGSIYWMNLVANKIETIQSVETVIDLNSVNHWQLEHMELAEGFTAEYTINEETNTATITITRTGTNYDSGAAVLAKLPVRIIYFDTDIKVPGFTAETYWTTYNFFAQDMKMDVDMGIITHVNGSTSTFSNEEFHVDTEMYTTNQAIDKTYWAEHGTTHVHTPVALADKAPTCTENGYTNRTFCEGCNSVVEWGITIPATGHTFEISGNTIVCDCGRESIVTGLQTIDGKNYYAMNGKLLSGWQMVENEWYLFDAKTFAGVDGEQYSDDAIFFSFDNGRLLDGTWVKMKNGLRYWYGPSYYKKASPTNSDGERYEIDGKLYIFSRSGYLLTDCFAKYFEPSTKEIVYYECDVNGVATLLTGPMNGYFYRDGVRVNRMGLEKVGDDYYYIGSGYRVAVSSKLYFQKHFVEGKTFADGTPLHVGYYEFDADGKMIIKNGPVGDYFYKNDVRVTGNRIVEFEGNFYYVGSGHKLAKSTSLYFADHFVNGHYFADGTPMHAGRYEIDADGKFIIKNGPVGDYFYKNDIIVKGNQIVEFEGNFYYVGSGHKLAKSTSLYFVDHFVNGHYFADGTPMHVGRYEIDADGKFIIKNGPVGDYFYKNDIIVKGNQIIEFEGNFYYVGSGHKLAKSTSLYFVEHFVNGHYFADGTPMHVGRYEIDADGKFIIKNGPVGDYFYKNDLRIIGYKLVEHEGCYYYVGAANKLAKNCKLYFTEGVIKGFTFEDGTAMTPGYFEFDADGKMIIKNGVINGYFYKNSVQIVGRQLVEYDGYYYCIGSGNKVIMSQRVYLSASFVSGKIYPDGSMLEIGYYDIDAEGRLILN